MFRIRLIPATIATASLLMVVKAVDVVQGTGDLLITQVEAQQSGGAAPADASSSAAATPASPAEPAASPASPASPSAETSSAASSAETSSASSAADKNGEDNKDKGKDGKKKNPVSYTPPETVNQRYTPVEVELLQNLAQRQKELDLWAKNVEIKEQALNVTEQRIDHKIAQINGMKKEVAGLLAQYNEKEDAKIHSLVEIYQNMKPKDAARIFDEVEMPILLLVIDKMSEKKAAPILAEMDSAKAKQITVELAEQRRLNAANFCAAEGAQPAAMPDASAAQPATQP